MTTKRYSNHMEAGNFRLYNERWKAIEEVEQWNIVHQRFRLVEHILIILGIKTDENVDKMQIIMRWAKIKNLYEQGKLKAANIGNE